MSSSLPPSDGPALLDERYTLGAVLGEGAMGRVYEGVHTILRKPVAIKVLHRHLASDARSRKRMLREARAASTIHHPNVVEIIDFGETSRGSLFLVMERLVGRDLGEVVAEHGGLPWPRALGILLQISSALAVAHEHGIVHRDIKPTNCIVTTERREDDGSEVEVVKLLDFGIAKVDEESSSMGGLTGTGEIMGTASYMAPELTLGTQAGVLTDIYSLGCMAYELLTGAPPFSGDNPFEVLRSHLEDPPVPPRKTVPQIPVALEAVVLRAIAKQPEERFASMAALHDALAAIPMSASSPAAGPRPSPEASGGPTGTAVFTGVRMGPGPAGAGSPDVMGVPGGPGYGAGPGAGRSGHGAGPAAAGAGGGAQGPGGGSSASRSMSARSSAFAPAGGRSVVLIVVVVVVLLGAVAAGLWLALG